MTNKYFAIKYRYKLFVAGNLLAVSRNMHEWRMYLESAIL